MKKILVIMAVLSAFAFTQVPGTTGGFYKDIGTSQLSNYVQLGLLPTRAFITRISLAQAVRMTNTGASNFFSMGVISNTNFFLNAVGIPMFGVLSNYSQIATNALIIFSSNTPTPVYGRVVQTGDGVSVVGTWRVFIEYFLK